MARSASTLQRLDRAVALGVLGAVLLAVVGMGEARAAVSTPLLAVDPSTGESVTQVGDPFCDFSERASGESDAILDFGDVDVDADDLVVTVSTSLADVAAFAYDEDGVIGLYALACALDTRTPSFDYLSYSPPFSTARFVVSAAGRTVCEGVLDFPAWALNSAGSAELWTLGASSQWTAATFTVSGGEQDRNVAFEAFMQDFSADFVGELSFRPWNIRVIDCTRSASTAPVSALALSCEPGVVSPGALVTCSVTGGDPGIEILWRASASPAFAGQGVRLDADGRGSFSFRVPETVTSGAVLVELVEWDRTATVVVSGSLVPTSVPAGEGMPSGRVALLGLLLLGAAGLLGRRTVLEG